SLDQSVRIVGNEFGGRHFELRRGNNGVVPEQSGRDANSVPYRSASAAVQLQNKLSTEVATIDRQLRRWLHFADVGSRLVPLSQIVCRVVGNGVQRHARDRSGWNRARRCGFRHDLKTDFKTAGASP